MTSLTPRSINKHVSTETILTYRSEKKVACLKLQGFFFVIFTHHSTYLLFAFERFLYLVSFIFSTKNLDMKTAQIIYNVRPL